MINSSTPHVEVGEVINGRYKIVRPLGSGSMGAVYLAIDRVLGESHVALKILHKRHTNTDDILKRFFREVELMNKVNHPSIARTFDVGQDDSIVYFSMEYLKGRSLDAIIEADSPLPFDTICWITQQILEGLEAIHGLGIIHRDLKPSNIIVHRENLIKITDFGIARNEQSELTEVGTVLGTLEYIAPEVILGHRINHQADLYSLGCILYKMICGRLPFDSNNAGKLLLAHVEQYVAPPTTLRGDTPQWLSHLTMKLLAKTTRERIQSATQAIEIIRANISRPNFATPIAAQISDHPSPDKATMSRIDISRKFQNEEVAKILKEQKSAKIGDAFVLIIGFILFILIPSILAVRSYLFISQILML